MTRKQLQRIARRFTVAVAIAALAVPTVASAHPAGNTGPSGGPNHGSATQIYVPTAAYGRIARCNSTRLVSRAGAAPSRPRTGRPRSPGW